MADEAEDVLELDEELEVETETEGEKPEQDDEVDPPKDDDDEETVIGFEGEQEVAPASESDDNSVIRELRKANREQAKRLAELEQAAKPKPVEVGEKPTLESCDYDEERFEAELTDWHQRKARSEAQKAAAAKADEARQAEWADKVQTYDATKASLGVANYDEAEATVFDSLPQQTRALLFRKPEKTPALVVALSKSPAKLEELSKLELADAAIRIGELYAEVKVEKRRKAKAQPDRGIQGKTSAGADKTLERLEREAAKTGDRTEVIRYKRQQRQA